MRPITKILIADDEALMRMVLQNFLTTWGYEAMVVNDGEEALRILESPDHPQIAILDWMMPSMNGITVCQHLSADQEHRPYIIMLTARSQTADLVEALNAGADDFLTKPVEPMELRARILAGIRIIQLKDDLIERTRQLEAALKELNIRKALDEK